MRQVGRVELLRQGVSRQTRGLDHPRSRPPFFLFIRPCPLLQLSRARKYTERVRRINDCCKRARNDGAGQYELTEPAPPGRKQDSREGRSLQEARVVRGCKPIGVKVAQSGQSQFYLFAVLRPLLPAMDCPVGAHSRCRRSVVVGLGKQISSISRGRRSAEPVDRVERTLNKRRSSEA
jgi:hypothetical protein